MKVFRRILIKIILLALVIAAAGCAACLVHGYPMSQPESALKEYLSLVMAGDTETAYERLDQSEGTELSLDVYELAMLEKKYALYESIQIEEVSSRAGTDGESYADCHVEFLDEDGVAWLEDDFTLKKQEESVLGLMDQWKVLSDHCLITNLQVTVPAGSTLYLDGEEAEASWIVTEEAESSKTTYEIPSLLPGEAAVAVRNPILQSLDTRLDPSDGDVDYSDQMATLKESAESACEELAVAALKAIYVAAVTGETDELETVFGEECLSDAETIASEQGLEFYQEDEVTHAEFESVGIYDYDAVFSNAELTNDENGAISTILTFSYHYNVQNGERVETGEIWADGENAWEWQTVSHTGEATAQFTMSYYEEEWHITSVTLPVIPASE
ncbi:MAG: hypothetical protein LUI13_13365 [Lachnospiraceae bacterium]|nr:hypothetical protein [Lachnospiraceae bacterium]